MYLVKRFFFPSKAFLLEKTQKAEVFCCFLSNSLLSGYVYNDN